MRDLRSTTASTSVEHSEMHLLDCARVLQVGAVIFVPACYIYWLSVINSSPGVIEVSLAVAEPKLILGASRQL